MNAHFSACEYFGLFPVSGAVPQARHMLALKPNSRAAASTLPNRSRLRKYSAFSAGVYLRYGRLGGFLGGGAFVFPEVGFPVRDELFLDGVSNGAATPGYQGLLQRPLEPAHTA